MKTGFRTLCATAVACAAIFLAPSSAPAEENFFQKFYPVDPCNWAGFYIGLNNGASFNHFHFGHQATDLDLEQQFYELPGLTGQDESGVFTTFQIPGHHDTDIETIGGMQTGFNLQFGHIVFGAEGSFIGNGSTSSAKSHEFQENNLFAETINQNITAETEFGSMRNVETIWNGFVGGKIGFCWNRFLFYGAGGAAFTNVHFDSWQTADSSFFRSGGKSVTTSQQANFIGEVVSKKMHTQGDVLTGWYGGGGVDFKLTNIVSTGVEYKHVDWGDVTEHLMMGANGPVFPGNGRIGLSADQVVFKVNILIGH
jgi:opacity protein-like surface antigen